MKAKCKGCNYGWETSSTHMYVSCPNCMNKVRIRNKLIIDMDKKSITGQTTAGEVRKCGLLRSSMPDEGEE